MKKYAMWVKILTFTLCVVLFLGVAIGGLGVLFAGNMGMYNYADYAEWISSDYRNVAESAANQVMRSYGTTLTAMNGIIIFKTAAEA